MCLLTLVFNSVKAKGLISPPPAFQPQEVTETLMRQKERMPWGRPEGVANRDPGFSVRVDVPKRNSLLHSFGPELRLNS